MYTLCVYDDFYYSSGRRHDRSVFVSLMFERRRLLSTNADVQQLLSCKVATASASIPDISQKGRSVSKIKIESLGVAFYIIRF